MPPPAIKHFMFEVKKGQKLRIEDKKNSQLLEFLESLEFFCKVSLLFKPVELLDFLEFSDFLNPSRVSGLSAAEDSEEKAWQRRKSLGCQEQGLGFRWEASERDLCVCSLRSF